MSEKELKLTATLDAQAAYTNADFVVIAAPTNYDSQKNFFDTSAVEAVIELVLLPNYAMNERFSTTKKLYHERKQFVKRLLKMQQIVAFFVSGGSGTAVHFWGAGGFLTVFCRNL